MTAHQTTGAAVLEALRPFDLKVEALGKYRANSPFRPGSNAHAFSLVIKPDGEHGAWHDFVSDESGSLYDLAERLGVALPDGYQPSGSKRSYTSIEDYAAEHGVTAAVLEAAGWQETTYKGRPALQFSTASGPRWRYLDGAVPTYHSPYGYQACWYGLGRAIAITRETKQPIVLCNGECSTVVAQAYGIAAACITGSQERPIPDSLMTMLIERYTGAVLVALDCDDKGRKAAPKIVEQLRGAGLSAQAIDLGGSMGFDLADYCHLHGNDAAEHLQAARPLAPAIRNWLTEAELEALPKPELIPGSYLTARSISVLYGPPGVGKTFVAIDQAMRVAIASGAPVLYVAAEDVEGVRIRKNAWRAFHKETRGQLLVWPEEINLLDTAAVESLIAQTRDLGLILTIFDTLAQCAIGSDENSSRDMGLFFHAVKGYNRSTGSASHVLHHNTKAGGSERGSSAIRGAAYTMIEISDEDGLIRVACTKAKNSQPFDPYYLRLVQCGESAVIVPADRVASQIGEKLTVNQRLILEFLALEIFSTTGATVTQLKSGVTVADKTLYRALNSLKVAGYITQGAKGDPYTITIQGKFAVTNE